MNIQTLNDNTAIFRNQVCDSGFRRDLKDFTASLPNNDENIISLREVANKVLATLTKIHAGDLPEALRKMIPGAATPAFTSRNYDTRLHALIEDKTIEQNAFYRSLRDILAELASDVEENYDAVENVRQFIAPYVKTEQSRLSAEGKAVVSIIFKDLETVTGLHSFTKTLAIWDRTLPLYHQLVTHSSPEVIRLAEVQNGSIDVVLNLNVDVAVSLAELFKYGLFAFSAYLAHKKLILPIAKAYFDNKLLLEIDEQKEKLLLQHVGQVVAERAKKQFERIPEGSTKVDNPNKIIESISNLVMAHIVRGNEYKILALPEQAQQNSQQNAVDPDTERKELAQATAEARAALHELPEEAATKLLEEYGHYHEEQEEKNAGEAPRKESRSTKK